MITVGVTGGIGSGKSVICKVFSLLGVPVFNADEQAKKLYDSPEVMQAVKENFGEKLFVDGALDRKKLAALIFSDKKALEKINSIIHPLTQKQFKKWRKTSNSPYVIKEAAILFESGTYKDCDKIITVTAPQELKIERIRQRDNRSASDILNIIRNQWTDEDKAKRSDFVIVNDEMQLVIPQVLGIHKKLLFVGV